MLHFFCISCMEAWGARQPCKMFFFRMSKGEQPQERMNVLVSRARAALRVWKSFRRRDERLYKYWAKHLEAETVSAEPSRLPETDEPWKRLAARIIGYSHLVRWNLDYSQFYAELCVAFHFREDKSKSSVYLGAFNLETSPQDPSRRLEVSHSPWWIVPIDKPFGDDQWPQALSVYRSQASSVFVWKDSHFYDQLERIICTLNRFPSTGGWGDDVDVWDLEETESRLEELEVFVQEARDSMVNSERGRRAQAVLYMLSSRARAALRVKNKTQEWSKSMELEIVCDSFLSYNKSI